MSSEPDVVEFGPAPAPAARRSGSRWHTVVTDRRLSPALAAIGGTAAVASLFTEWQTIGTVPGDAPQEGYILRIPSLVNTVWSVPVGPVYLIGMMLLAAAAAAALLGPPPARAAAEAWLLR
ncbi:hypothetical protein AB0J67_34280, partial [Catellatospora sp. NPDC049609]